MALGGALASPAGAGWTRPAKIAAPTAIDVLGSHTASSPDGAAAVSFNEVNIDAQATAGGFVALASPHGGFGAAQQVPGTQEVLAIAYAGRTLDLLTASGPPGQPCCSSVRIIRRGAGAGFGPAHTLATGIGGGAIGRLVPLANGRMLAMLAGPQQLWVTEAGRNGRFGALRALTSAGVAPAALAVTGTDGGGATVAWTQGASRRVMVASTRPGATPSRPHVLLTLPTGHAADDLRLAARPGGATLAWTESFSDAAGGYHARAMAADLVGPRLAGRSRPLSGATEIASALALAADGTGDEVATWNACPSLSGVCVVQSAARFAPVPARGRAHRIRVHPVASWFGRARSLGGIDAGQSPELTMAPDRASLIAWITGGRVVLAGMLPGATRFGPAGPMSGDLADNLALGFGPTGEAVATWTQGTFVTGVYAAVAR
jgi:hypothetical protein